MSGKGDTTPDDIGSEPPSPVNDKNAKRERDEAFEKKVSFTELRNERFKDQSLRLKHEHWARLVASGCVFLFVLGWLALVGAIITLAGLGYLKDLSEKVLISLLATTSVTVIGLLAAVVRYLFPPNPAIFGHESLPTTRSGADKPKKKPGSKKRDE